MFTLIEARYERASVIVTSNKPFSAWGEDLGAPAPSSEPDEEEG
jgi:DNA replication protein DnaC